MATVMTQATILASNNDNDNIDDDNHGVNNTDSHGLENNYQYEDSYEGAQIILQYESGGEGIVQGEHGEGEDADDNDSSPRCGDKCPCSPTNLVDQWCKPIKVHPTAMGLKPKAGNYETGVQQILSEAIPLYHCYLSTDTPYPVLLDKIKWAKTGWQYGCKECETQMGFNDEIIKLVSGPFIKYVMLLMCCTFFKDYNPWFALPGSYQDQDSA
jgi:hypothetical protein